MTGRKREWLALITDAPWNSPVANSPQRWISEIRNRGKECQRIKRKGSMDFLPGSQQCTVVYCQEMWVVEQMRCLSSNHQPVVSHFVESCLISQGCWCHGSLFYDGSAQVNLFFSKMSAQDNLWPQRYKDLKLYPTPCFWEIGPFVSSPILWWEHHNSSMCPLWILHPIFFTQCEH